VLIVFINATPATSTLLLRNNILSLANFNQVANQGSFTHENNLYHLVTSSTKLGFTAGSGENQGDPLFMDAAKDDFHLKAGSPAINAGKALGHPLDFDGHALPCGAAPEIGAFEFGCY
jgi:hypothetical protein